jgi:hypothetical protein
LCCFVLEKYMQTSEDNQEQNDMPILGLEINDGVNAPFADLYLDMFPEFYDVE